MIINWIEITKLALVELWQGFLGFIPALIGAIIVFVIGWIIAVWIGKIIAEILRKLKVDKIFEKGGWEKTLTKANLKVNIADFIGSIARWVLVVAFLQISVEILEWVAFAIFLKEVLIYLPNVIIAVLIFVVAIIVADIVEKVVRTGVEGIKIGYGQVISMIAKWSILIFAILTILHQLGIAPAFMEILLLGIVAMLAISFGLAFGLGGKEVASEILQDFKKKLKEK